MKQPFAQPALVDQSAVGDGNMHGILVGRNF